MKYISAAIQRKLRLACGGCYDTRSLHQQSDIYGWHVLATPKLGLACSRLVADKRMMRQNHGRAATGP